MVEALLRKTNLWDVRKQKLGGYSGGMRQRFGVAVALLGNPTLMIVDEPTAGLDPAERVRFLNLLSELGENSVVLLSTHIVEDVSELCTRMAIIDKGRDSARSRAAARRCGSPGPDLAPRDFEGRAPCTGARARGDFDEASRGPHRRARLRRCAPGPDFEPVEPDLEDVYFSAMTAHRPRRELAEVMKFREIFRFEFMYQARRVRTWLYFAVLFVVAFLLIARGFLNDARNGGALVNSPYVIAFVTGICNVLWLLMAAAVAGDAAARDAQTRMHPLLYTTPISKADYLGGRFLAAFVLNALILLAVPRASCSPCSCLASNPRSWSVPAGGIRQRLRRHCVADRLRGDGDPVLVGGIDPPFRHQLPRQRVLLFVVMLRRGRRWSTFFAPARRWESCSIPPHFFVIGFLSRTWTPIREEHAPDRAGSARCSRTPPVGRHRAGRARFTHSASASLTLRRPGRGARHAM